MVKDKMEITPIGEIITGFSSKFGIPRGAGLVPELRGELHFYKPYSSPDYFRGIEQFSHIWVIWQFSENGVCDKSTVRPPRLGGNERIGVFATRSPFRPSALGISALKLIEVKRTEKGIVLVVGGADILSGTPIIDVKPYIPFTDSIPEASGGFAEEKREKALEVHLPDELLKTFPERHRDELFGILSQDPRPAYIEDGERVYSFEFYGYRIKFRVSSGVLYVTEIFKP